MGEILSIEQRMMEAEYRWGIELKRKTHQEACGTCPFCGGTNRFLVFANGRYMCRPGKLGNCGREGWLDEEDPKPLSATELLDLRVKALEHKEREHEERLRRLEEMHKCKDHIAYHQALTEDARQWWYDQGMMPSTVDEFTLGYCKACPTAPEQDSYTIPVLDFDGHLINIRHRLANPINGDKYRPHRSGLGASLWGAHLLKDAKGQRVVVMEGEKKAIVFNQFGFLSVGLMGQHTFKREWLSYFDGAGSIVVALDPDAKESAQRLGEIFVKAGFAEVRIADFCVKPDDAIICYGATINDIEATIRLARPV